MKAVYQILLIGCSVWVATVSAQVSSKAPLMHYGAIELVGPLVFSGSAFYRTGPDNSKEIRKELLDANTIRFIAEANGLTKADLATVEIAPGFDTNGLAIYQIHRPDTAFKILSEQLSEYVNNRQEGHSKTFLLAALTNHLQISTITDLDLRILATNQPWLAISRLKKEASGTYTNKAGEIVSITTSTTIVNGKEQTISTTNTPAIDEIMRWVSYTVAEGDIAWRYICTFKPDRQVEDVRNERFDAKELDPKYSQIIKAVESEVAAEMKKSGEYGKFGSVHAFWGLKKEKLRAKGIDWRSPAELNRNVNYD